MPSAVPVEIIDQSSELRAYCLAATAPGGANSCMHNSSDCVSSVGLH